MKSEEPEKPKKPPKESTKAKGKNLKAKKRAKKKTEEDISQIAHYNMPPIEDIEKALIKHRGNLLVASIELGCSRRSLYNWMEQYENLKNARTEGREYLKDVAENKQAKIIENINEKKPSKEQVTILNSYLMTQAKDRGHVMKIENDNKNFHKFEPIEINYLPPPGAEPLEGESLEPETEPEEEIEGDDDG